MRRQGGGVLLAFGGGGTQTSPGLGGFKIALDAVEGLRRQWSLEHGGDGIRFVTIKTGGIPGDAPGGHAGTEEIMAGFRGAALLDRLATLDDVGRVAAFVASDQARTMTSATVYISCGAFVDI